MVVCAVYGPRAIGRGPVVFSNHGALECIANFSSAARTRSAAPLQQEERQAREKAFASCICDALKNTICLERFPKSVITLYCTVLQADGGELSAAINCATLALADAAIDMRDMVCACSGVWLDDTLVVDPDSSTLARASVSVVFGCETASGQVTQLQYKGNATAELHVDRLQGIVEGCKIKAEEIRALLTEFLLRQVSSLA
jgi:exosome complex component MTR3